MIELWILRGNKLKQYKNTVIEMIQQLFIQVQHKVILSQKFSLLIAKWAKQFIFQILNQRVFWICQKQQRMTILILNWPNQEYEDFKIQEYFSYCFILKSLFNNFESCYLYKVLSSSLEVQREIFLKGNEMQLFIGEIQRFSLFQGNRRGIIQVIIFK
ncbi:unnamed protein product [Paramecium sonneborni]|uniref:Uncharacterized protein n=1 Tax=Paramecium sonneborni TaxID=65129 RepID=A0A8S1RBM3_9CILI|nr:unnamed protein product [Paramecium sonneborni]